MWMYDSERIGKDVWNTLLKNSDEVLEIDGEYNFKETVESCYLDPILHPSFILKKLSVMLPMPACSASFVSLVTMSLPLKADT